MFSFLLYIIFLSFGNCFAQLALDNVTGCALFRNGPYNCNRLGGDVITIYGSGFTDINTMAVIVGGNSCNLTLVTLVEIQCTLNVGWEVGLSVLVFGGLNSAFGVANQVLSYKQCQPGTAESSEDYHVCSICSQGYFSNTIEAVICSQCDVGTFSYEGVLCRIF